MLTYSFTNDFHYQFRTACYFTDSDYVDIVISEGTTVTKVQGTTADPELYSISMVKLYEMSLTCKCDALFCQYS